MRGIHSPNTSRLTPLSYGRPPPLAQQVKDLLSSIYKTKDTQIDKVLEVLKNRDRARRPRTTLHAQYDHDTPLKCSKCGSTRVVQTPDGTWVCKGLPTVRFDDDGKEERGNEEGCGAVVAMKVYSSLPQYDEGDRDHRGAPTRNGETPHSQIERGPNAKRARLEKIHRRAEPPVPKRSEFIQLMSDFVHSISFLLYPRERIIVENGMDVYDTLPDGRTRFDEEAIVIACVVFALEQQRGQAVDEKGWKKTCTHCGKDFYTCEKDFRFHTCSREL